MNTEQRNPDAERQARVEQVDRRQVLLSGWAGAALLALLGTMDASQAGEDEDHRRSVAFSLAYNKIVGDAEPVNESITLELPEIAENGNTVQFKISVESPMSESDYIKTLHLLSTANPQPAVAAFRFTTLSGRAQVSGRMRLAKTQDVFAVAERSDGKFLVAITNVKVTIGGCGN